MFHDLLKKTEERFKFEHKLGIELSEAYWMGRKEALEEAGKRITTDDPKKHEIWHFNYVYVDREGELRLDYIDGERDVVLLEYILKHAGCDGLTRESVHDKCTKCGRCPMYALYVAAAQAAEMRERVFYYEDHEEAKRVIMLPCAMGDSLYAIGEWMTGVLCFKAVDYRADSKGVVVIDNMGNHWEAEDFGETVFLDEAEAREADRIMRGRKRWKE